MIEQKELGPNWFACVMGTGILANAAVGLPHVGDYLFWPAFAIWLLASLLLVFLVLAKLWQTATKPQIIKRQMNDPVMAQFFGAPPMALLTIAGGILLFGNTELWGQPLMSEPVTWYPSCARPIA